MNDLTIPVPEIETINTTLRDKRVVFLFGEITCKNSRGIIKQLLYYADSTEDVTIFMQSEGGAVEATLGILSVMETCPFKTNIVSLGNCYSAAALLLLCGTGKRYASRHSTLMLHLIRLMHAEGSSVEIASENENMKYFQKKLDKIIISKTAIDREMLKEMYKSNTDVYFTPRQALKVKIIDSIWTEKTLKRMMRG